MQGQINFDADFRNVCKRLGKREIFYNDWKAYSWLFSCNFLDLIKQFKARMDWFTEQIRKIDMTVPLKVITLLLLACTLHASTLPTPPKEVRVFGQPWHFKFVSSFRDNSFGSTECLLHEIQISASQNATVKELVDTILHEWAHAATCDGDGDIWNELYNNDDDSGEHGGIAFLAHEEKDLILNNKKLIKWFWKVGK